MKAVRSFLLFCAIFGVVSASAMPREIVPGKLTTAVIPEVTQRTLFNSAEGFFIVVPEEAIEVEILLSTAPPEANLDLYARFGEDVSRATSGDIVSDFQSINSGGSETIVIAGAGLQPGTYYIAIEAGFRNPQTFAFLQARVELTPGAQNLETIAADNFEDNNPGGWERNYPAPVLAAPGSTTGDPDAELEVQRGPLDFSRNLQLTGNGNNYFVAPKEYLGKIALLGPNARMEFDLAFDGDDLAERGAEVRLMNGRTTFRWAGATPTRRMTHYVVPFDASRWQRLSGAETFEQMLQNVIRLEISADYGTEGTTFLDNIVFLGKAEPPSAPAISTFDEDSEGWTPNFPEAPFLISRALGVTQGDFRTASTGVLKLDTAGNPGGFMQVRDLDDAARDYLVAPDRFLGDLGALGPDARIEFDRKHISQSGATRGVEIRLIGFGGAYSAVGPPPPSNWRHYSFPLRAANWVALAGDRTFAEVLRAVQRIEVSMDERTGSEESGLDNFELVVPDAVVPELSVAPDSLTFAAVEGGNAPDPQMLDFTSNGPVIEWVAAASSGAPWITVTPGGGETPSTAAVTVDPTGLAVGVHRGFVEVAFVGSTVTTSVPVVLNVVSATGPLISDGGVVNSATYRANAMAGGEITGGMYVSIFGERLAARLAQAATIPLPTELAGTRVTMGGIPAPLIFVSPSEVVAIAPQALTVDPGAAAQSLTSADVIVIRDGEPSPGERIRLAPIRPRLFSQDQTGSGPGAILNIVTASTVELNSVSEPAQPGQAFSLFGTGFGPTQLPVQDGFPAGSADPVAGAVRVTIGGVDAPVAFAGLGVQFPHLYQVNATVPSGAQLGCNVPVRVIVDGVESNEVTMAITGDGGACE